QQQQQQDEIFWLAVADTYHHKTDASSFGVLLITKLRAGIQPTHVRGTVWKALSNANALHLEPLYRQLKNERSPFEKLIQRDVSRTFPNSDMFGQESGQRALERVLRAYSLYDADMSEEDAFCVFVRLMETYGLRTLFTLSMDGLHLCLFQFDVLLLEQIPELHGFLSAQGIHPQMYASQWFLTVFAYVFPLPLIFRIYDIMLAEGVTETIMRIGLALLKKSTRYIVALTEFEDVMHYLSTRLMTPFLNDFDAIIQSSVELGGVVTRSKLDALEEKYTILRNNSLKRTQHAIPDKRSTDSKLPKQFKGWFGTIKRSKRPTKLTVDQGNNVQEEQQQQHTKADETRVLHQQVEDLVSALSQVQKDNTLLRERIDHFIQQGQQQQSSRHAYGCSDGPSNTTSTCYCELQAQLTAAKSRISDLEAALQKQQPPSTLSRSGSINSDRSSFSTSSFSTLGSIEPALPSPAHLTSIPLIEKELCLHQHTISKQELMLPSSYYTMLATAGK
ncbi:rab-GTPase-TBC domain-containing protein, partial [Mucor lusitanicus]